MTGQLGNRERDVVLYALRHARGRYFVDRASQLSGVPRSTIYDWRRERVYVPDFDGASPVAWSYRDLVYLRFLAWLRQVGVPRPTAAQRVSEIKTLVVAGDDIRTIRSDGKTVLINDERTNRFGDTNVLPFDDLSGLVSVFDLLEPIEELRRRGSKRTWAPDLVVPSEHTFISPWVLAGDPCVTQTRIPTAAVYALRDERGLDTAEIVEMYPGLTAHGADDAYLLERRLRGFELPEPAAA